MILKDLRTFQQTVTVTIDMNVKEYPYFLKFLTAYNKRVVKR